MPDALIINVTDARGCRRSFEADRVSLDCGAGLLELQAGCPAYCRTFDDAVLSLSHSGGETVLVLHKGTASLSAAGLHILCEHFADAADSDRAEGLKSFPAGWPETNMNIPAKNNNNHIL